MDLRDKLDWDNRIEDLDDLLEEPFEIDAEKDFPLMCVVSYNIRTRHRVESLRGLKLSEYERDLLEYFIAYDYSPNYKIVLSYLFHNLAREGVSQDSLQDIRKFREGILFSMQGIVRVKKFVDSKVYERVWAEFAQYPQLEQDFYSARTRLRESTEKEKVFEIMDTTRTYLEKVKKEFEDGDYRPKHIDVKLWQDIRLRGAHDFGTAINHFDHSLRY